MTDFLWVKQVVDALQFEYLWPRVAPIEADWQRLARLAGGSLPSSFVFFIENYGGAVLGSDDWSVEAPIIEPCSWGKAVGFGTIYPLQPGHAYDIEESQAPFMGRIPPGVLVFSHDAGGNMVCLDVCGEFPGSVWFWDHEQRWFTGNLQDASEELEAKGIEANTLSVHGIIREWARMHPEKCDRPADYMGMYRIAPTFEAFIKGLIKVPYE